MKTLLARLLRGFGLLEFDLLVKRIRSLPSRSSIAKDKLALVESGNIKKWACLRCPGGCGEIINLSLNPGRRPRWTVSEDFWARPSVHPSVHQRNQCGCHFWIKNGRIQWCKEGRPSTELGGRPKTQNPKA